MTLWFCCSNRVLSAVHITLIAVLVASCEHVIQRVGMWFVFDVRASDLSSYTRGNLPFSEQWYPVYCRRVLTVHVIACVAEPAAH